MTNQTTNKATSPSSTFSPAREKVAAQRTEEGAVQTSLCLALALTLLFALPGCNNSDKSAATTTVAANSGPAKVEVDNSNYDFGSMQVGEEKQHTFVITNKGTGELKLTPGKATCKCTSFTVDKLVLKPGEQAKAHVTWVPKEESDTFRQAAPIDTNDPLLPNVQLNIVGIVRAKISIRPGLDWDLGSVSETQESEFVGRLYSPLLDSFKIVEMKCTNPNIKPTLVPMSDTNLKKIPAKSGYEVHIKTGSFLPIGQIKETLGIKTDAGELYEYKVNLTGRRPGPLRALAPGFNAEHWTLNLGTFPFKEGRKRAVNLFYEGPGEIQVQGVDFKHPHLKVKVERDPNFKGRGQLVVANFEVIPLDKPEYCTPNEPIVVKIATNQPAIGTINLSVFYKAQ